MHALDLGIFMHIISCIQAMLKKKKETHVLKELDSVLQTIARDTRISGFRLPGGEKGGYFAGAAKFQAFEHRAIMQVCTIVLAGRVEQRIVDAVAAFVDCYMLASRRWYHRDNTLQELDQAIKRYSKCLPCILSLSVSDLIPLCADSSHPFLQFISHPYLSYLSFSLSSLHYHLCPPFFLLLNPLHSHLPPSHPSTPIFVLPSPSLPTLFIPIFHPIIHPLPSLSSLLPPSQPSSFPSSTLSSIHSHLCPPFSLAPNPLHSHVPPSHPSTPISVLPSPSLPTLFIPIFLTLIPPLLPLSSLLPPSQPSSFPFSTLSSLYSHLCPPFSLTPNPLHSHLPPSHPSTPISVLPSPSLPTLFIPIFHLIIHPLPSLSSLLPHSQPSSFPSSSLIHPLPSLSSTLPPSKSLLTPIYILPSSSLSSPLTPIPVLPSSSLSSLPTPISVLSCSSISSLLTPISVISSTSLTLTGWMLMAFAASFRAVSVGIASSSSTFSA
ncbi:unnamed protein product [Closterium sp. Yama58-4]|nr:unnamed protein product [Closterium sp. Yama58-4]